MGERCNQLGKDVDELTKSACMEKDQRKKAGRLKSWAGNLAYEVQPNSANDSAVTA
jgi:hypothetical protein